MIVVHTDARTLADAEAIAAMRRMGSSGTPLATRTVRRNLEPIACHLSTRANLYDPNDPRLAEIKGRAGRRRA